MGIISLGIVRQYEEMLFAKTETQENGCLIFKRFINPDGYGELQFRFCGAKKNILAHRAAYMLYHNMELTKLDVIRHTCDNPACIAEAHLLRGTHNDNVQDRVLRGRSARGAQNGRYVHGRYVK